MAEESSFGLNEEIIELRLENERLRNMCLVMEQMSVLLIPIITECKCNNNFINNCDKIKTKLNVLKLKYEHLKSNNSFNTNVMVCNNNNSIIDKIKNCNKSTEKLVINKMNENEEPIESIDENNSQLNNDLIIDFNKQKTRQRSCRKLDKKSNNENNSSENSELFKNKKSDQMFETQRKIMNKNKNCINIIKSRSYIKKFDKSRLRDKQLMCQWVGCGLTFRDKIDLENHMWRHTGKKSNRCEWSGCGKQFTTLSYLKKHQKLTHLTPKDVKDVKEDNEITIKSDIKPAKRVIPCDWPGCEKLYSNRSNVLKHMKKKHLDKKIYKCQFTSCTEAFVDKRQLIVHKVRAHNLNKPNRCDWPGCEFSSCYPQKLNVHKLRHSDIKEFKCLWPECGWSFRQNSHLKTHMLKHTGEKPWSCEHQDCDRKFQTKQSMRIHLKRFHKII